MIQLRRGHRCSIQIVDLSNGYEKHVKKLTVSLDPVRVLAAIEKLCVGHLVTRKTRGQKARDRGHNQA